MEAEVLPYTVPQCNPRILRTPPLVQKQFQKKLLQNENGSLIVLDFVYISRFDDVLKSLSGVIIRVNINMFFTCSSFLVMTANSEQRQFELASLGFTNKKVPYLAAVAQW